MDVQAMVKDIEKTVDCAFQTEMVQRHVKSSFAKAVGNLNA
jgi:hypothetical protein